MLKKIAAGIAIMAALGYGTYWTATYSDTYRTADGMKYVEYHRGPKKGTTCMYPSHDNWNQFPIICADTNIMIRTSNYRKQEAAAGR